MKKLLLLLLSLWMLTGCTAQPVFETVDDLPTAGAPAPAKELQLSLPEEAARPVMEGESGACLYDCGDYTVTTQVLSGGDLEATMRQLTGFSVSDLSHMKTKQQSLDRYDCVWTAVGESGEQVCRAVVLDDGSYHYTVTVMADAEKAGALSQQWQTLLRSVRLNTD